MGAGVGARACNPVPRQDSWNHNKVYTSGSRVPPSRPCCTVSPYMKPNRNLNHCRCWFLAKLLIDLFYSEKISFGFLASPRPLALRVLALTPL